MFFGLPDDAVALREGLREVLADACTPATIRTAWDGSSCDGLWKELGSFGLLGLLVEEPRGGLGLDELAFVAAMEEAGYAGVPGPLVETVCALPELDLPLDSTARLAVQRPGVAQVPYAGVASHVLRLDDSTLLEGFTADPVESVDRSRRLAVVQGSGSSAEVDVARLTTRATLGTAAFLLGLARRQVDITVEYLKNRKQFGVAIGSFQGLKHPLAEAVVGTEFAWPVVMNAAYVLAEGGDGTREVSHAKAAASDAAYQVSRVCLQAHGAMGYTVEYDLHLFMKRTWALAKDWGTAAEHRARVAEGLL